MNKPHWSETYIGLAYREFGRDRSGCDCWGLVRMVYQELLGIDLPDYLSYSSVDEHREIDALMTGAAEGGTWKHITRAMPLDVVVFRRGRLNSHIGIVVHDGLMLHMAEADCAKIESYRTGAWAHRLNGVYRHFEQLSRIA